VNTTVFSINYGLAHTKAKRKSIKISQKKACGADDFQNESFFADIATNFGVPAVFNYSRGYHAHTFGLEIKTKMGFDYG
jgi:hypothetical protein